MGFKVWEYHLSTKAIRRQYYPVFKVKIYSGTDNFQATKRQLELHIYTIRSFSFAFVRSFRERRGEEEKRRKRR